MHLVDVHVHLDHPRFAMDLSDVLTRAKTGGVSAIIAQGVCHEVNLKVLELTRMHAPLVKAALGLYPLDAMNVLDEEPAEGPDIADAYKHKTAVSVDKTLDFIRQHKDEIVAIGEVGMDFKFSDDREHQVENFKKIIALSKEIKKPLIIHSRKAELEVIDLLEQSGINKNLVLLHCFSGKKKLVRRAVELGYSFSVPCNVTRSQQFQLLVQMVPLKQLLTETDGPYLPADGFDRSEPAHVIGTIGIIAQIKGMTPHEVADNIYMNYQRMFG